MNDTVKPSKIGLNYGVLFGLIMVIVFMLQQFVPFITPFMLSIINLIVLGVGLTFVPLTFKKQNAGLMSYGQGLGTNGMVILISTLISALFIYLYVKCIDDFYLESLKEERLQGLIKKMPEEQAEQLIAKSAGFFNAEFIMIPLVISKFVIGFVFTFIVVGILARKEPEFMDR